MRQEASLCVICAWRRDCQKRFLRKEGVGLRCPDFSRDITIKDAKEDAEGSDKKGTQREPRDL
jgi:hypothetical protein